jgi:hypothetical protein
MKHIQLYESWQREPVNPVPPGHSTKTIQTVEFFQWYTGIELWWDILRREQARPAVTNAMTADGKHVQDMSQADQWRVYRWICKHRYSPMENYKEQESDDWDTFIISFTIAGRNFSVQSTSKYPADVNNPSPDGYKGYTP